MSHYQSVEGLKQEVDCRKAERARKKYALMRIANSIAFALVAFGALAIASWIGENESSFLAIIRIGCLAISMCGLLGAAISSLEAMRATLLGPTQWQQYARRRKIPLD